MRLLLLLVCLATVGACRITAALTDPALDALRFGATVAEWKSVRPAIRVETPTAAPQSVQWAEEYPPPRSIFENIRYRFDDGKLAACYAKLRAARLEPEVVASARQRWGEPLSDPGTRSLAAEYARVGNQFYAWRSGALQIQLVESVQAQRVVLVLLPAAP